MKIWGLLLVCVAVASIECEQDIVPEYPIKTPQEAAEALTYIANTDAEFFKILLENRLEPSAIELLKAIDELERKKGETKISVENALLVKYIKSEESWGVISILKRMIEENTRGKNWAIKVKSRFDKHDLSDSKYSYKFFELKTEKELKIFNERIALRSKLQASEIIPKVAACRIGHNNAIVIFSIEKSENEFYYNTELLGMNGINRGKVYVRAGMVLLRSLKVGGFIKGFNSLDILINPSNVDATRFNIFRELYPQEPYLAEVRAQFVEKGLFKPGVDFAEFHAKYVLKYFIEGSEKMREDEIRSTTTLKQQRKGNKLTAVIENKQPLPQAFMEVVNSMLSSTKSLEETVKDMGESLEKEECRLHSSSDSPQQGEDCSTDISQWCAN